MVAIVVVVAGRQGLVAYQDKARTTAANAYLVAVEATAPDALEAIAAEGGEGYPMLAQFAVAARLAEAGDDAAEDAYLVLANDAALDPIYREAAMLFSVMNASGSSVEERMTRIGGIAGADGPWQKLALELMIGLSLEKGDIAAARTHLQTLRFSPDISADLNQRLLLIDAALGE
ncbi:MAG: hypothetical protein J4F41_06590 [Alphaproteobacteria bacterium]|nr:hypothetical protein [Alphaproteobacteria bacterium]